MFAICLIRKLSSSSLQFLILWLRRRMPFNTLGIILTCTVSFHLPWSRGSHQSAYGLQPQDDPGGSILALAGMVALTLALFMDKLKELRGLWNLHVHLYVCVHVCWFCHILYTLNLCVQGYSASPLREKFFFFFWKTVQEECLTKSLHDKTPTGEILTILFFLRC